MATGLTLSGRYELRTRLGAGGAGAVWRGFDTTLQREVAIKLIALDGPGLGVDIDAPISRFRREARAVAQLNHPNIVAAYDFGVHEDVAFLVMELIEGASLSEHLRRRRAAGLAGFDEAQTIHIARQVCAGLAVAHRARLVHRDLKPSNLMVADANGRVKIVDFGIARIEEQSRLTRTGSYLGTLPYVAPEQMDAEPIDGRADLYSLACVLFELMTGRSPYDASTPMQWMSAHQKAAPAPLRRFAPAASAEMESLLQRMLAKNPSYRPPDADAVSEALAQVGAKLAQRGPAPLLYGQPPHVPVPLGGSRGVAQAPRAGVAAPPSRFPTRPPSSEPPPRPPGITITPGGVPPVGPGFGLPPSAPVGERPGGAGSAGVAPVGPGSGGAADLAAGPRAAAGAAPPVSGLPVSAPPVSAPPVSAPPISAPPVVGGISSGRHGVVEESPTGGQPPARAGADLPLRNPGARLSADSPATDDEPGGAGSTPPPVVARAGVSAPPASEASPEPSSLRAAAAPATAPDEESRAASSAGSGSHGAPGDDDPAAAVAPPREAASIAIPAQSIPVQSIPAQSIPAQSPPRDDAPPSRTDGPVSGGYSGSGGYVGAATVFTGAADSGAAAGGGRANADPPAGARAGSDRPDQASPANGAADTRTGKGSATDKASTRPGTAGADSPRSAAAPATGLSSTAGHDGPDDVDVASDVAGPTVPLLRSKTQGNAVPRQAGPGRQTAGVARHSRPTAPVPPAVPISPTMRRGQRPPGPPGLPAVTGGDPAPTRARRLGQNIAIVAVVLAAIVLVATVVAALSHPKHRPTGHPPSAPAAVVPAVGDCYAAGWATAIDADAASVWSASGDSTPVGCANMHAFEVVAIGTLKVAAPPDATSEAVREAYGRCVKAADDYLGGPWRGAYAWLGVAVPDTDAWSRGARWAVCVLRPTANWQGAGISAAGSLRDGLRGVKPAVIACFQLATGVPTDCDAPHSDEVSGLSVWPPGKWPGHDALYHMAGDGCETVAAHFLGFLSVDAWTSNALGWQWWNPSPEQWELGNRTTVCTVHTQRKNGMTGSVRGLRNGIPK